VTVPPPPPGNRGAYPPPPVPAYGPPAAPPGPPTVIDVGTAEGRRAGIAAALLILLGLGALILGFVEAASGRMNAGAIGVLIFGALLLILGLIPVINSKRYFRPRRLIIEPAGIRWDDPKGKSWAMPWYELAAVSISLHEKAEGPEISVSGALAGAAVDKTLGKVVRVRLDLFPVDPRVRGRHPEMEHLWEFYKLKNGYRQALGSHASIIQQIEWAVSHYQPRVYRGVQRTKGMLGRY
jgi:hypothetical protein